MSQYLQSNLQGDPCHLRDGWGIFLRMRILVASTLLLLAACGSTGPVEVGPGRYRILNESPWSYRHAEAQIIREANEFCAARDGRADIQMGRGVYSKGVASAEFVCR
jgi:hypothetical protein